MIGGGRVIFALDVQQRTQALAWVERLAGEVGAFKIGLELFVAEGPGLVREVVRRGERVFLDLKFHDIPATMAGASRAAGHLGAFLVNVHALAGPEGMARAAAAARVGAEEAGRPAPRVLAVTVLTSHGADELGRLGLGTDPAAAVLRLTGMAREAGLDGVVASPHEAREIRRTWPDAVIVTPGVRPAGAELGDQIRVATPTSALTAGADFLVIGRPIRDAADPVAAARTIAREVAAAEPGRPPP